VAELMKYAVSQYDSSTGDEDLVINVEDENKKNKIYLGNKSIIQDAIEICCEIKGISVDYRGPEKNRALAIVTGLLYGEWKFKITSIAEVAGVKSAILTMNYNRFKNKMSKADEIVYKRLKEKMLEKWNVDTN
jgi:hypothetical protein